MKPKYMVEILISLITITGSIAGSIITSKTTITLEERKTNTMLKSKIVEKRIELYKGIFKKLDRFSTRCPQSLSKKEAIILGLEFNKWLYGEAGMYASENTRRQVADLRTFLLEYKLKMLKKKWGNVIIALREDIGLRGDLAPKK